MPVGTTATGAAVVLGTNWCARLGTSVFNDWVMNPRTALTPPPFFRVLSYFVAITVQCVCIFLWLPLSLLTFVLVLSAFATAGVLPLFRNPHRASSYDLMVIL